MSDDDDLLDRVRGKGLPGSAPLGPVKRDAKASSVVWRPVPGKPWLEQSNESPPRIRTVPHPIERGYR